MANSGIAATHIVLDTTEILTRPLSPRLDNVLFCIAACGDGAKAEQTSGRRVQPGGDRYVYTAATTLAAIRHFQHALVPLY